MSKIGLSLAAIYLLISGYLIYTQGIFGESFIALILGLPWVLIPAFFEFGGVSGAMAYVLILLPIALNAVVLYFVGYLISRIAAK